MARISSTTLFNFTDSLDYLIDNLKHGFYCSNTYEKLPLKNNGYRAPMACFCDIPLSLIKEHFDWYGRYGIGIKRAYARKHGVKPVWYVTSESMFVKALIEKKDLLEFERVHLLPYLKPFLGFQEYKGIKDKRKKFYDEREWRYVPAMANIEQYFGVHKNSIPAPKNLVSRMELDLTQVEYIIIDKEEDFERLISELLNISNSRNIRYETLISKILTSRQIEKDF